MNGLSVHRKPSGEAAFRLRQAAMQLLQEGFGYREALDLFRLFLLEVALAEAGRVKKKAAARLGIGRDHIQRFYDRAKELI